MRSQRALATRLSTAVLCAGALLTTFSGTSAAAAPQDPLLTIGSFHDLNTGEDVSLDTHNHVNLKAGDTYQVQVHVASPLTDEHPDVYLDRQVATNNWYKQGKETLKDATATFVVGFVGGNQTFQFRWDNGQPQNPAQQFTVAAS
jgi:hypothetical protein